MPEFEETQPQSNPSHSYTPSKDAKPRTRRRSGGFKKEPGEAPKGNIGEVDAKAALKEEKLSGSPKPEAPRKKETASRELKPVELKEETAPASASSPETQPAASADLSAKTKAAIERVEARILERKAERQAKRKERGEPKRSKAPKSDAPKSAVAPKESEGGLIAAISGFFGKLLGSAPEQPAAKPSPKRPSGNRPQGKGPNRRGGPNRGGGGRGRGGPNRRRSGGNGDRRRQPQSSRSE